MGKSTLKSPGSYLAFVFLLDWDGVGVAGLLRENEAS